MTPLSQLQLPAVSEVLIRVRGRWGKTVRAEDKAAQAIADLWQRLPPGKQKRCHTPVYELQFLSDGLLICLATVCWRCNNVRGTAGGRSIAFEFDSEADISQQLLAEIRRVNPGRREDA